jgi:prepilin-type N-terminal cleavage/methylation domain-containing protein
MQKALIIKKQRGFTLSELTVVLLIGALLAAAAMFAVPRMMSSYRASKIIDEFNVAIPAIQTAYQNQGSYANLTTAQVANNGWMSRNFTTLNNAGTPTGELISSWGAITFAPGAGNNTALVELVGIPTRECLKIAEMFNSDNYITAEIGGTEVKNNTDLRTVDLDAVGTQCNANNANEISFTFGRA